MKTRIVFGALLWVSIVFGAVRLFGSANDPIGFAAPLVIGGLVGGGILLATRSLTVRHARRQHLRSGPATESELPAGPRRILLADAGFPRVR